MGFTFFPKCSWERVPLKARPRKKSLASTNNSTSPVINEKQGSKGLPLEGDTQESSPHKTADTNPKNSPRGRTAAKPIAIPVGRGESMPSKVWERLQKGGSLLGDPEERMMAEGQDGNTPGSGLVKVRTACYYALVCWYFRAKCIPYIFSNCNICDCVPICMCVFIFDSRFFHHICCFLGVLSCFLMGGGVANFTFVAIKALHDLYLLL